MYNATSFVAPHYASRLHGLHCWCCQACTTQLPLSLPTTPHAFMAFIAGAAKHVQRNFLCRSPLRLTPSWPSLLVLASMYNATSFVAPHYASRLHGLHCWCCGHPLCLHGLHRGCCSHPLCLHGFHGWRRCSP